MQAHKVIEKLLNDKSFTNDFKSIVCGRIKASVKFSFDYHNFIDISSEYKEVSPFIKLPFPLCYFEIPNVAGILCFHLSDREVETRFFYYNNKEWFVTPEELLLKLDLDKGEVTVASKYNEDIKFYNKYMTEHGDAVVTITSFILKNLYIMSCSNVITFDNEPSKALNKKRIKGGKLPLFTFKTLHLKLSIENIKNKDNCGTHASPRQHLRRGHIRRYPNYNLWINNMVVGNPQKGIVLKDYKVT